MPTINLYKKLIFTNKLNLFFKELTFNYNYKEILSRFRLFIQFVILYLKKHEIILNITITTTTIINFNQNYYKD